MNSMSNDNTIHSYLQLVLPYPVDLPIGTSIYNFRPNCSYLLSTLATSDTTTSDINKHIKEGVLKIVSASSSSVVVATAYDVTPPGTVTYVGFPKTFSMASGATGPFSPTVSGGTVRYYTVSPALPNAMTLNATSGAISGTPTGATGTVATDYTITAAFANSVQQAVANITIAF